MRDTMNRWRLLFLILAVGLGVAGCGRKNLPVAPAATTPVGTEADPTDNAPSSLQNFQRGNALSTPNGDLTVSPAEVSRSPTARKKSFPLDVLLN